MEGCNSIGTYLKFKESIQQGMSKKLASRKKNAKWWCLDTSVVWYEPVVSLKVANFEDFWVKLPMKRGPQLMWRQMRPNLAPQIPKTGNIEKMPFSGV